VIPEDLGGAGGALSGCLGSQDCSPVIIRKLACRSFFSRRSMTEETAKREALLVVLGGVGQS